MRAPADDPGWPGRPRVRHLTGPFAPPWYLRQEHKIRYVLIVLFVIAPHQLQRTFIAEASYRYEPRPYKIAYERSNLLVVPVALVVLARRRIVAGVRGRVRVLDDVHARGGWRAAGVTGVLNLVYLVVVLGPGRWAVTSVLTAYATSSRWYLAADEVVAEAVARYLDRGTGLVLLMMVVEAALFQVLERARRRHGLAD